jgi:16S rRNA A1518/A1519 N6-dimethyltransferase RsmA/KsgA/DIM1 with predicted DNA glycosylase/AP lyase activity
MSSGQQWWADQQAEARALEYESKLNSDADRLGINATDLEKLRNFKVVFNKSIANLPYGVATQLMKLLNDINTN